MMIYMAYISVLVINKKTHFLKQNKQANVKKSFDRSNTSAVRPDINVKETVLTWHIYTNLYGTNGYSPFSDYNNMLTFNN